MALAWDQWSGGDRDPRAYLLGNPRSLDMFAGLLVYDNFTIFLRLFLLGFTALIIFLTLQTGIPDREETYSNSPSLYTELDIPTEVTGSVGSASRSGSAPQSGIPPAG